MIKVSVMYPHRAGCRFDFDVLGGNGLVQRLRPGVPFALEILDPAGTLLERREAVVLAPGHSAREFVRLHGREALSRVAKLHFKNTRKILG